MRCSCMKTEKASAAKKSNPGHSSSLIGEQLDPPHQEVLLTANNQSESFYQQ